MIKQVIIGILLIFVLAGVASADQATPTVNGVEIQVAHQGAANDPQIQYINDTNAPNASAAVIQIAYDNSGQQWAGWSVNGILPRANQTETITVTGYYKLNTSCPSTLALTSAFTPTYESAAIVCGFVPIADGNWHRFAQRIVITQNVTNPIVDVIDFGYLTFSGNVSLNDVTIAKTQVTDADYKVIAENKTVVCLGDSITYGGGIGYDLFLQARLPGWNITNKGVAGNTPQQMINRWDTDVKALNPDYVIILGGANLVSSDVPAVESGLQTLYGLAKRDGITPIACKMTPLTGDYANVNTVNAWIESYAKTNHIQVIDFYTILDDPANPGNMSECYNTDGVHPNNAGRAMMGTSISFAVFSPIVEPVTLTISSRDGLTSASTNSSSIELATETQYTGMDNLYSSVRSSITSGYTLASLIILALGAAGIMKYLGFI